MLESPTGIESEARIPCISASGLTCAQSAHYADAVVHFSIAREQIPESQARVLVALDGFVESHTRYWEALHEASHRFVVASTDQEARFADLQEVLADTVDLPLATVHESNGEGRLLAVDWRPQRRSIVNLARTWSTAPATCRRC